MGKAVLKAVAVTALAMSVSGCLHGLGAMNALTALNMLTGIGNPASDDSSSEQGSSSTTSTKA